METLAWILLCKAKSQGLISSTVLSLFTFCAVNSVSTGTLLHFPVETCHCTEVAVCKCGRRRKPNVIQLLTLVLYLQTHDSPHHPLEVFPTFPVVPRESTVLKLVTQTLPTSLPSHHCKLCWGRKPASFQVLKHPAKPADFTESHGHLLNNSLNASGGQQDHASAPAVTFLRWLSPASCQAPVLPLYLCLQALAEGQPQTCTWGSHQSLEKQQGSDIHIETGNFNEPATQTRPPVPRLFRVEKGLPASLGAGQQLPTPHSHTLGPWDGIFRCSDLMFLTFISRWITLYLKVRNSFYFIPLSFSSLEQESVRVEDSQKLAREALPQTALHPMEGKGIRPPCPAQLQDRQGAGRAKEGIAGRTGSYCNRAKHIASCMLCADARYHSSAACWLLPVMDKKSSFHGTLPRERLMSFPKWCSALFSLQTLGKADAGSPEHCAGFQVGDERRNSWDGSFQGPGWIQVLLEKEDPSSSSFSLWGCWVRGRGVGWGDLWGHCLQGWGDSSPPGIHLYTETVHGGRHHNYIWSYYLEEQRRQKGNNIIVYTSIYCE